MKLQYISDGDGNTTGVFIPIREWELLKSKYSQLKEEEETGNELSDAQKSIIDQRLENYKNNPDSYLDWEDVQKDVEGRYGV
ncbi:MAG: addiction module protein [Bacteroidota bacterium]